MNRIEFSKTQNELDQLGFTTNIERVSEKCFNYTVNFEIVKTFRNRISAKRRIINLHKKTCNAPTLF